jgi:hypothetical protein
VGILNVEEEIENWKGKPKELVMFLSEKSVSDPTYFGQIVEVLKTGTKVEMGTCADVIEEVSKVKPEIVVSHIAAIAYQINSQVPRVKWGTQEAIGNLSSKYPVETEVAIPHLLKNTADESTVVKWCAAFALSEIVKNNPATRTLLIPKIKAIVEAETNNGVKNVYLKALKKMFK